jgi:hypothetical protein
MPPQYAVGEKHWFIRITNMLDTHPLSNNLLTTDLDALRLLYPVENIELMNLTCNGHLFEDDTHSYTFRDPYNRLWCSRESPSEWSIASGQNLAFPRAEWTALAPVDAYLTKLIHNTDKAYFPYVVDHAKLFMEKLQLLYQQIEERGPLWDGIVSLKKAPSSHRPEGHLPFCNCVMCR